MDVNQRMKKTLNSKNAKRPNFGKHKLSVLALWCTTSFLLSIVPVVSGTFFINATPNVFSPGYSEVHNVDFHHVIPSWVIETIGDFKLEKEGARVLLIPSARTHIYKWGYGSSNDVLMENQNVGVLSLDYGEGFKMNDSFNDIKSRLFKCLSEENSCNKHWLKNKLFEYNISHVLVRRDFNCRLTKCALDDRVVDNLVSLFPNSLMTLRGNWELLTLFEPRSFILRKTANNTAWEPVDYIKPIPLLPIYHIKGSQASFKLNVPMLSGWVAIIRSARFRFKIVLLNENQTGRPSFSVDEAEEIYILFRGFFLFLIGTALTATVGALGALAHLTKQLPSNKETVK